MELRNHSRLTFELQVEFSKKNFWHSNRKTIFIIELVLVAAIILVLSVYQDKWWISIICGILAIALPVALTFMLNQTTKRTLKETEKVEQSAHTEMEYCFRDEKMEVKIYVQGFSQLLTYTYDQFVQIVETSQLFVFILDNNQALYVEKSGFYDDNYQELSKKVASLPSYVKMK